MDRSILNHFFPEDKFIIEYDDYLVKIKTKGEPEDKDCVWLRVQHKDLHIHQLWRCGIAGNDTLKKIEEIARLVGCTKISLYDLSRITICGDTFDMAVLKILTRGESWYNSLGYKSENYDSEKNNNEVVIKKTLNETFSDPRLDWKHKAFTKPRIIRLLKRDDLTEEDLENHSLQSISNMLLKLASDCENEENEENEEARLVLAKLIDCFYDNSIIKYNKTLIKTIDAPLHTSEKQTAITTSAAPKALKTSRIVTKRGGRKRTNIRKTRLKRKTLRKTSSK
jgi:hypothetical protein